MEVEATEPQLLLSPIANPLAGPKLSKRTLRLVKKAAKEKGVKRGVKEVVKAIRKGEKGICVLAGDVSPLDVISHIPVLCEDYKVNYIFVPSKESLGTASQTKRPTSVVLISAKQKSDLTESYNKILGEVQSMAPKY